MPLEKNYNATFCGKLPIHQTNSIQPHGVLLLVDDSISTVLQVSENIPDLLSQPAREVAGKPVSAILSPQSIHNLRVSIQEGVNEKLPLTLTFNVKDGEEQVLCLVHTIEEGCMIEALLNNFYPRQGRTFIPSYQRVKQVMQYITQCQILSDVCNVALQELKRVTGFDKVMIYRFDENWNGTVLAEEAENEMERQQNSFETFWCTTF